MQIHELRLTQIFVKSELNSLKAATPLPTMLTNPIISQVCFCDVTRLCSIASNNLAKSWISVYVVRWGFNELRVFVRPYPRRLNRLSNHTFPDLKAGSSRPPGIEWPDPNLFWYSVAGGGRGAGNDGHFSYTFFLKKVVFQNWQAKLSSVSLKTEYMWVWKLSLWWKRNLHPWLRRRQVHLPVCSGLHRDTLQ